MTKTTSSAHAIADITTEKLAGRIQQIEKHLDAIDELMADAVEMTDEQRRSALRLMGPAEVTALQGVLDFAEARPELFDDLAAEDNGDDPSQFETRLVRNRLANADLLNRLADRFAATTQPIADSALYVTTLAKRPLLAAYEIAKPFQQRDREHGKMLNEAINLYRARALAAVQARKPKPQQ
jgi:hypothetical protein